ncbi:hypothetical protein ABXJ56_08040 [Microbacterium chocolatum]|uniref:hypothetical protein n=1 Tax=Microbacterium aurantiacum TaxID=162393 RepID=UPI00338EF2FD
MKTEPARHLVLEALSARSWRLCDRSAAASDPSKVLAYIEQSERGGYDAAWVRAGGVMRHYQRLDDIFTDAAELAGGAAIRPGRKPAPIPARPPLTRRPAT